MLKMRWFGDNVYGQTGYSNNVRELLYAMSQLGVDAKAICPKPPENAYLPPKCEGIVSDRIDIDSETHVSGRTYVYEQALKPWRGKCKSISAIMVLEGDRLPEDWVATANVHDFLWTASEYGKRQFIANGVIPELIRVIPHGIDPSIFYPNPHFKRPDHLQDEFIFAFVGGCAIPHDRKGADMLARAFYEEFKPHERATLLLKINPTYGWTDPYYGTGSVQEYLSKIAPHPKIGLLTSSASQEQLATIYNLSDIHAMPSMGEAFSMNLAESMACGRTVITTNWSGPLDYCKPEFSYLVDVEKFVPAHYGAWDVACGTKWAAPSMVSLRQQMRYAFDNQTEVKKKGETVQRYVLDNLTWKHAAQKVIEALR